MKKYMLSILVCTAVFTFSLIAIAAPEANVPDGFRVIIIGSGNPKLDIKRGGPSTLVQYKDKYFLVDCGQWATQGLLKVGIEVTGIKNMLFTLKGWIQSCDPRGASGFSNRNGKKGGSACMHNI